MDARGLLGELWYRTTRRGRPRIARECNLCGYRGFFGAAGKGTRADAKCPRCNSAERHRLFKLWFDQNPRLVANRDVLHFAPERSIAALIRPIARSYTSADVVPGRADLALNLEALTVTDCSYDCLVCLHVLEHVDDRRALKEIHRVLRPAGSAIVMVPVVEGWSHTYEDPTLGPELRAMHFGQADHLRIYGADIRARIGNEGFGVAEFTAWGPDVLRYGLLPGEKVFIATRCD